MHPACPGLLLSPCPCAKRSQPRLPAASEGSSEVGLGSRSSAFLQCSCFLGFSQRVAEQLHPLFHSLSGVCAGAMRSMFFQRRECRVGKEGWQVVLSRLPRRFVCVEHWVAVCCDRTEELKGAIPVQGLASLRGCASQLLEDTSPTHAAAVTVFPW